MNRRWAFNYFGDPIRSAFFFPHPLLKCRIRALCDKLLLASEALGTGTGTGTGDGKISGEIVSAAGAGADGKGEILGLRLGDAPSVLGLNKLHLLKEVTRACELP